MKIKNVIKALEKENLTVEKIIAHTFSDGTQNIQYVCVSDNCIASWFEQAHDNGNVDSILVERKDDRNDAMTDYFPGTFYDSIKSLIKRLTR